MNKHYEVGDVIDRREGGYLVITGYNIGGFYYVSEYEINEEGDPIFSTERYMTAAEIKKEAL